MWELLVRHAFAAANRGWGCLLIPPRGGSIDRSVARGLSRVRGAAPHVQSFPRSLRGGLNVCIALCSVSNGDSEALGLVTPGQGGGMDKIDAD